jgi:hypothetical protein
LVNEFSKNKKKEFLDFVSFHGNCSFTTQAQSKQSWDLSDQYMTLMILTPIGLKISGQGEIISHSHLDCGSQGVLDLWSRLGAKTGEFFRLPSHNPPCQWPNDPRITCKSISLAPNGSKE